MADEQTTTEIPASTDEGPEPGAKTFDAEYVAKLRAESAKYRTEAKANAEAAKRLAEIEEANKTEAQRLTDRTTIAEAERDAALAQVLRFKIAAKHGLTEEDADLFLTGTDEETLTKQAERLSGRSAEHRKNGNHVPREGTTSPTTDTDEKAFARSFFGAGKT